MDQISPENRSGPAGPASAGPGGPDGIAFGAGALSEPGGRQFGEHLEPALRRACGGLLGDVRWFRTDWQRGGALTGYSNYQDADGLDQPVVVKLPVSPVERLWLKRLGMAGDVAPHVYAEGLSLNGYDMAWVVMERLAHGPLGPSWGGREFDLVIEAACRFYEAAAPYPGEAAPRDPDWGALLDEVRRQVGRNGDADAARWNRLLKQVQRRLSAWAARWAQRPRDAWCHGDLHLGNAMSRVAPPEGPAVLFDFALTHRGHWLEDAVYFEQLYWGRRQGTHDRNLCRRLARERKRVGLPLEPDWADLARVRRCLVAIGVPAARGAMGAAPRLDAARAILEREVGT